MKSIGTSLLLALIFGTTMAYAAENQALGSDQDKTSYAVGVSVARDFQKQDYDVNPALFAKGFQDAFSGSKMLLTDEEMATLLVAFQQGMMQKQIEAQMAVGDKNKKEGEAFLAANKTKKGVKTTASGLQYKVLKEGTGKTAKAEDSVTTHYRGTLIDGTEFDSSYSRNEPATFPVNGVIRGWSEALQMMKAGAKWQLFIPPDLAYGARGAGEAIGPNAVLIFEIELLTIDEAEPRQAPKP
ncbi:MAG: FKBP-type peptidyl-prolyl cis-trans isomerase [Desulfobacteraceae bacterium]|nr:FKBP-type peptidyl-prolyl cis-trans isomerase [Desulfobacteraceae bacterium]